MALNVNTVSDPPPKVEADITRKSASFHPSVWGDRFLAFSTSDVVKTDADHKVEKRLQVLKQEANKMLTAEDRTPRELISLVDDIQRLGLSYHFEAEFDKILEEINGSFHEYHGSKNDDNLHEIALSFRLLRQQGHNVSSDVFYKFKDSNGEFKENTVKDVRGMLSLFEATHFRVHGENILEGALEFTTTHLSLFLISDTDNPLMDLVRCSLKYPLRKSLNRLVARHYISIYHKLDWHNQVLLDLAKCDFNLVQKLHQVELGEITRWWKDLDFANKLPFARDRVVECYFWITGVYFEPQYASARTFLTKVITLTSTVDDIYDAYGTLEELDQFTDAIEKWHVRTIDQLPEYMRHCYQALLDVFAEAEEEMLKEGMPTYGFGYAKEAFKRLARAYLHEAKWCQIQYFPTLEEYMSVTLVSAGYKMLSVTSFVPMGNVATREAFDWITKEPLIERAASVINRLHDDIVGHEFEMQRPNIPTAVDIFMKQYGVSKETAYDALQKRVINAWKDMNQECLHPTAAPMALLTRIVNFACVINLLYDGDDGYTHSSARTKDMITSILLDPVPV